MKSALIISYFFPPTGGAGVQRTVKFVKYLRDYGWQPVVLTVSNPSVPVFDASLQQDIDDRLEIIRTRTLEPDYKTKNSVSASSQGAARQRSPAAILKSAIRSLANVVLQPDPQVLWLPTAVKAGIRLAKREDISVIFVSAPPFSSLLIAALVSKYSGKPLVVDYRDEWDISNEVWENKMGGRFTQWLQQYMQAFVLRRASHVVATTLLSQSALANKVRQLGLSASVSCVYNGFDQADLRALAETPRNAAGARLVITYVGTLWNLTSIGPIVKALLALHAQSPALAAEIELRVVGRKTQEQQELLEQLRDSNVALVVHDYVSHKEAIGFMKDADVLLLLLSDLPVAARVMPGKTFEYLATGNHILAIAPAGEVWKVLDGYAGVACIEPGSETAIAGYFQQKLQEKQRGTLAVQTARDISRFERRQLTGELAQILLAASQRRP
jgi:glycosyltransferase involved in cell wall biosynthesis